MFWTMNETDARTGMSVKPDNCYRFFQWTHANWIACWKRAIERRLYDNNDNMQRSAVSFVADAKSYECYAQVICVQLIGFLLLAIFAGHFSYCIISALYCTNFLTHKNKTEAISNSDGATQTSPFQSKHSMFSVSIKNSLWILSFN